MLIGWNGLMIVAFELPVTRITGGLNPRRVMAIGYCLIGAGFASNVLSDGLGVLVLGTTLFTLGEMLVMPMANVWIARIAPERMRGRYIGALATAWGAGSVFGMNVGLRVFAVSPNALWIGCAACGLAAAVMITVFGKERAAKSEEVREVCALPETETEAV
jgi:MFS family permease